MLGAGHIHDLIFLVVVVSVGVCCRRLCMSLLLNWDSLILLSHWYRPSCKLVIRIQIYIEKCDVYQKSAYFISYTSDILSVHALMRPVIPECRVSSALLSPKVFTTWRFPACRFMVPVKSTSHLKWHFYHWVTQSQWVINRFLIY